MLWLIVVVPAGAVFVALRVLLGLMLRVLRPFIVWPLVMGSLGGLGATAYFAASRMWSDALRAGSATLVCALLLALYSVVAQAIDATHFDEVPNRASLVGGRGPRSMVTRRDEQAERLARDELRTRVDCRTVLEAGGWELDAKENTRGAVKYRNGAARIVIVTHEGKGWFDLLADRRGDALALAQYVWGGNLGHARKALRPPAGIAPKLVPMRQSAAAPLIDAIRTWDEARQLYPGSQGWRYLIETRGLPVASVERAVQAGGLREGIYGTVWARHQDAQGRVTGWEMRGPNFKGYVKDGSKTLFFVGTPETCNRVAVTESFIDALSLASIERWPDGTLYASTGGGYGPETAKALQAILPGNGRLVAATDQGTGGEILASRLRELATAGSAGFGRLCPETQDWKVQLRQA